MSLILAGLYNILWGSWVVARPEQGFAWLHIDPPNYPEIWQSVGMAAGVFGLAYLLAAANPFRHWPVVAAGAAGKVLAPLGFVWTAHRGHLPWSAGWTIFANDIVWWVPFGLILHGAWRAHRVSRITASPEIQRMALHARTQYGVSLLEMSRLQPLMLVFLRHRGCTFCREAIADVARQRAGIRAAGVEVAFIHMGCDRESENLFPRFGLGDVPRVSDPDRHLYRAFGLRRGGLLSLFGPRVWWRGVQAAFLQRHGVGMLRDDVLQMPGVFLVFHGEVLRSFRHRDIADRPDYVSFCSGDIGPELALGRS